MRKGEIVSWSEAYRWGAVEPDLPSEERLYFNGNSYDGERKPEVGMKVSYETDYNDVGQKYVSYISPIIVKDETESYFEESGSDELDIDMDDTKKNLGEVLEKFIESMTGKVLVDKDQLKRIRNILNIHQTDLSSMVETLNNLLEEDDF